MMKYCYDTLVTKWNSLELVESYLYHKLQVEYLENICKQNKEYQHLLTPIIQSCCENVLIVARSVDIYCTSDETNKLLYRERSFDSQRTENVNSCRKYRGKNKV